MGTVVDLKDLNVRTPDQVLRVFYSMFSAGTIRLELWKVYAGLAIFSEEENGADRIDLEETAILFDQLIALVEAVEVLKDEEPKRCFMFGRTKNNDEFPACDMSIVKNISGVLNVSE